MAPRTLDSKDIPQFNRIRVVAEYVTALAKGESYDLASRQVKYCQQAARVLGFLDANGGVTPLGVQLSVTPGNGLLPALREAFEASEIGREWMQYQGVSCLADIDPESVVPFLTSRAGLAESTAIRRGSSLKSWAFDLSARARPKVQPTTQLSLSDYQAPEPEPEFDWPSAQLVPHNEGGERVRAVLADDFADAEALLIITGYASLQEVVDRIAASSPAQAIRLLFGNEPYRTERDDYRLEDRPLADEVRDFWLEEGVSVEHSQAILAAIERLEAGQVEVRIAGRKPMHAKVYATPNAITVGSSNFTRRGLSSQTEGNARFVRGKQFEAAQKLAEGFWALGKDWQQGFLDLLRSLLCAVSWQEALARGCAVVLDGEWAKDYLPAAVDLDRPLWPHQRQGIAQALHILIDLGSVLIADATGSGKTRMGGWVLRGLHDHLLRTGASRRSPTFPALVAPPAVLRNWQSVLLEAELPWLAHSHGPLSQSGTEKHEDLMVSLRKANLLAVDEAHNFMNRSDRTRRLQLHVADHVVLFTATPINRGPSDLLALVELLGPDNFDDAVLEALTRLSRYRSKGQSMDGTPDLDLLKAQIRKFMVRRTRSQLNRIAAEHEAAYKGEIPARYPRHAAQFYPLPASDRDRELAEAIDAEARQLRGVIRVGKDLRLSPFQKTMGMDEGKFLDMRLKSAAALARYTVLERLRSSRLALVEHAMGTPEAISRLSPGLKLPKKRDQGDTAVHTLERGGQLPRWSLSKSLRPSAPEWLTDPEAHRQACEEESQRYMRIADLACQLSGDRERRKVELLEELTRRHGRVLAYDGSIVSLFEFQRQLRGRDLNVATFTGEGGTAAKKRAKKVLGRDGDTSQAIALCTDAFSEGMNLQGASCVVHLDTPTVIRTAEQRAGRVDRMDSRHDAIEVWWPKDPPELAPRRKELIVERHEVVRDLIGKNLNLPDEVIAVEDLAKEAEDLVDADLDGLFDAFRPVRQVRDELLREGVYERMRTSQADVVACVSAVAAEQPWAFLAVGARDRAAPRWVFFGAPEADPQVDFEKVAEALQLRLGLDVPGRDFDAEASRWMDHFVHRLGVLEDQLLPPRRRRALNLARAVVPAWLQATWASRDPSRRSLLQGLDRALKLDGTEIRPDPRELADAWMQLLRPYRRAELEARRRGKPLTVDQLEPALLREPIPTDALRKALRAVPVISPVGKRVVAVVVGVPSLT